jgi:predicted amidohydrolase YtcJ
MQASRKRKLALSKADLVVWNKYIYEVKVDEIKDLKAEATLVGGKVIYGKL